MGISVPTKFCPTKKEYRDKLKLKHGLDLHYTGKTDAIVTDTQGVVSTKYGWYPRTKQCADVKKRATLDTPNKFTATFQDANGVKGGTYKFAFVPMPSETTCSKTSWFPSGWKAVQSKFDRANLCYFY